MRATDRPARSLFLALLLVAVLAPGLAPSSARAAELSLLGGTSSGSQPRDTSYAWEATARYDLLRHLGFSLSWLNEGHLEGHRRDGVAGQGWGRVSFLKERVSLGIGAGIYYYFDTIQEPDGAYRNAHGWSPIYSLQTTYYAGSRWFLQAAIHHVDPGSDIPITSYLVGAGYRLRKEAAAGDEGGGAAGASERTTAFELTPFIGQVVVNSPGNPSGIGGGVEFRMGLDRHVDWTVTWLNESVPDVLHRTGIGTQLWLVDDYLDRRLTIGLGAGLYPFVDYEPPQGSTESRNLDIAGLLTVTAGWRFPGRWFSRFEWNRVASHDSRDTDMFLIGVGYRWE